MNLEQIKKGILAKFEKCRIVFWQDEDAEFEEQVSQLKAELESAGISVIALDDESHLEVKYRVELLEPKTSFLLYGGKSISEPTRDWLFDIRLYAQQFYADSSSMVLNELGMRMEFRQLISGYKKFFGNKQRYAKLRKLITSNADKEILELAMIATLAKVDTVSFHTIIHQLITQYNTDSIGCDEFIDELEKFGLADAFWLFALKEFGYLSIGLWAESAATPNLKDLIFKLLVTDCQHGLVSSGADVVKSKFMQSLSAHLLPVSLNSDQKDLLPNEVQKLIGNHSAKRAAVVNFVTSWRESRTLSESYNQVATEVALELEIRSKLDEFKQPNHLLKLETFEEAEQQLIKSIAKDLPAFDSNDIADWISQRLRGHWCHAESKYASIYKALKAAKQFFDLKEKYVDGFVFSSAGAMYQAYEKEIYQFDYYYRLFAEHAIDVHKHGSDILKATGLVTDMESMYVDWYLHDFAIAWGNLVDNQSLLANWNIPGIPNQQHFFNDQVKSVLNKTQIKRVFVIISDALRYEVAHEIHQQINDEKRFKAEIGSQLGVVPSYTQLGMGSLLPHQSLTAHLNNKVEYKADGISVHGLENRQKVLAKHGGIAFKADEVLNWTNQEGRDKVKDAQVVYIYHDEIDAIGDDSKTENQTFEAVRNAIDEIKQLVSRIINRLNGSRVIVTADHGFLFKMTDVTDSDKTTLKTKPSGAVEAKKRYVIGSGLPSDDYYWTGKLSNTAGINIDVEGDAEFMIPRGSNRFHFVGGAKFIHGGIMPQEICVPLISIKELHDEKTQVKHAKQKVSVVPLKSPLRVVSNIDRIQFLQTDAVGDKFKARELEIWVEDPEGKKLSATEKVLFDSSSAVMEERKRNVQIKLEGSGFDRTMSYKLIMKDTDASQNLNVHSVTIDLAFEDDFF
ncbi:BREX-1 system phosphatase PglZ type A [Paraglaciecola sp. L1A13]|uniref:BREX-1 system phosphatase PglZ type A n=1 Tax=Paraglaciecola sp. L1A13 TaxID=2686359 RepID=UPI00131B43F0|nr:BREX-1 system phosphatase PglZ type A [Paraglaciecola sp. L1A13]